MAPKLNESTYELIDSHEGRLQRVESTVQALAVDVKEISVKHDVTQATVEKGFAQISEIQKKKLEWRSSLVSGIIITIIGAAISLGLERLIVHH